jgi:exopolysaccharide biosynthesis protein
VLALPHGAPTGITLDDLRDKLAGVGVENAVFLDGSDSVTFYTKGSLLISPGKNKDRTIPVGLGFRA